MSHPSHKPALWKGLFSRGKLRKGPFAIIEFSSKNIESIATPVFRTNPGFITGGKTLGGAREFVIPNRLTAELENLTIRIVE